MIFVWMKSNTCWKVFEQHARGVFVGWQGERGGWRSSQWDRRRPKAAWEQSKGDPRWTATCSVTFCSFLPDNCRGMNVIHEFFCVLFQSFYEGKMSRSSLYWKTRFASSATWATVILSIMIQTQQSGSGCYLGPHLMMSQRESLSWRMPWGKVGRLLKLYYIVCVPEMNCWYYVQWSLSVSSGEPACIGQQWCWWSRLQCFSWPGGGQCGTSLSTQESWDIWRLRQSSDEQQQE